MWFVIILIFIIIVFAIFSDSTTQINTDIKRITEFVFGPCDIKPFKKYSKKELKELLGLFDKDIYLKDFSSGVMHRGEIYFYEDKIDDLKEDNQKYTCKVIGTEEYNVSLSMTNNEIIDMSCTCPHYKRGNNCKHIYALLYSLKCSENKAKIIKNIELQIVPTATLMVKYFEKYCEKFSNPYLIAEVKKTVITFNNAIDEINNCMEELKGKNTEDTALNILKTIYDTVFEIREAILKVLNQEKERSIEKNKRANFEKKQSNETLLTTLFILNEFNKKDNKPINKSPYSEKEMDYYGLDDFEKDLVRKGEYAPWDFEHEDTVEGDYYHYD